MNKSSKLALRYVRPFEVLKIINLMAYRIVLPLVLTQLHNVFHVSYLKNMCLTFKYARFEFIAHVGSRGGHN